MNSKTTTSVDTRRVSGSTVVRPTRVGQRVVGAGNSHVRTLSGPVTVIGFGEKRGERVVDLSDGQWAYVSEMRVVA